MGGLCMIATSARSLLLAWVSRGHEGMVIHGIWPLQAVNAGLTASTVLAPPIPQSSVVGPRMPLPGKEQHLHHDHASQRFVGNGTTHSVHSQAVSLSMPAWPATMTHTQGTATISTFIAQKMPTTGAPCVPTDGNSISVFTLRIDYTIRL